MLSPALQEAKAGRQREKTIAHMWAWISSAFLVAKKER
jgi:hypothetical protein